MHENNLKTPLRFFTTLLHFQEKEKRIPLLLRSTTNSRMDFQLKIEVLLCHVRPSLFALGDQLVLYTLLAPVCDATDLTNLIQWLRILRSLFATYAVLRIMCSLHGFMQERHQRFNAAIADGIQQWFLAERPLHVAEGEREECMNRLMLFMAEELKKRADGTRYMLVPIQVLGASIEGTAFEDESVDRRRF